MELEYLSNESETQIAVATFDFLTWYDIKNAFVQSRIEFYLKMISEMFRYMKSECHRIEIINLQGLFAISIMSRCCHILERRLMHISKCKYSLQ